VKHDPSTLGDDSRPGLVPLKPGCDTLGAKLRQGKSRTPSRRLGEAPGFAPMGGMMTMTYFLGGDLVSAA
jgi:hypothetical protein